MKGLQTSDIFTFLRIVKSAEMREALKPIIKKANSGKEDAENIGIDVILTVMECVSQHAAENAVYSFLAAPFEMTEDEVKELPIPELIKNLKELAKENDLADFFSSVSDLMSLK